MNSELSGQQHKNDHGRAVNPAPSSARSAESCTSPLAHARSSAAQGAASSSTVTAIEHHDLAEPVYDLTVEDAHEFFAEGLLVHNCGWQPDDPDSPGRIDASVYLAYGLLPVPNAAEAIGSPAGISLSAAANQARPGGLGGIQLGRRGPGQG